MQGPFGPVQATQYDLQFTLFGFPVRVTPWFWLTGVMLGFDLLQNRENGLLLLLMWLGVLFVSILVHELGHATIANLFGYPPSIVLYHFGGLAFYEPAYGYTTPKAILISFAGPAFGFVLGGAVYGLSQLVPPENVSYVGRFALAQLFWVNIAWGLVNLLPVLPLDGGQITREVCLSASPYRGMTVTQWISIIVAGCVGAWFLVDGQRYNGLFFILLAVQNYRELQQRRAW
ncbi:MAG: site-2 protease family protein [Planctomycetaceae bacterium]